MGNIAFTPTSIGLIRKDALHFGLINKAAHVLVTHLSNEMTTYCDVASGRILRTERCLFHEDDHSKF